MKGRDLAMFKSNLSGRNRHVEVDDNCSQILETELGVPQRSALGPILF